MIRVKGCATETTLEDDVVIEIHIQHNHSSVAINDYLAIV